MARNSVKVQDATDPRWRARRRGARFCAPACGRGCTVAEHRRAVELAHDVAVKLGKGWTGIVWENMGWHTKVEHATGIEVRCYGPREYSSTVEIGSDVVGNARHIHQLHGRGSTPSAAVKALRAKLDEVADRVSVLRAAVAP